MKLADINKWDSIIPLDKLRPLEKVFKGHLKNLTEMIESDGIIKCPIIADKKTGIILDGSHRYAFFLSKGYKTVPVKFVNYDDENIRVGTHLMHRFLIKDSMNISKEEVVKRGLSGNLFPPRTTRHFFPFRKTEFINLPLSKLRRGKPINIAYLTAKVSIDDEIKHNQGYLIEIDEEIDEILKYLEEIRQTKEYLKKQIERLEK